MTTKKSPKISKTIQTKIKKATHSNVFTSIAISSILLNVLLLVAVFVFFNPNSYDINTVKDVTQKYCDRNFSASDYSETAKSNNQTTAQAIVQHDITCKTSSFEPYYQQAINSYKQAK